MIGVKECLKVVVYVDEVLHKAFRVGSFEVVLQEILERDDISYYFYLHTLRILLLMKRFFL